VAVKQLAHDFASYLYLPRLQSPAVLAEGVYDGLGLLTWNIESFAYADSFDEANRRYLGLRCGQPVTVNPETLPGLLVHPDVAQRQKEADEAAVRAATTVERPGPGNKDATPDGKDGTDGTPPLPPKPQPKPATQPKRFYGSVELDSTRVGRDAGQIATELIAHLSGLVGAKVRVTLEIEAEIPDGVPDTVVRTVTENGRTLHFTSQGFEVEQ
jgi:hypothetical protein